MIRNRTLGILLLILMTSIYVLRTPFVFLDFQMRREYIAEYLCINKDQPMTVCRGRCYLARELNDQQSETGKKLLVEKSGFKEYLERKTNTTFFADTDDIQHRFHYLAPTFSACLSDIFHPPQFLSFI